MLKKNKNILILAAIIALLGILCIGLIISTVNAKAAGTEIGNGVGTAVGRAIGSVEAIANAKTFFELGVEEALLAKDTEIIETTKKIEEQGAIRVLEVEVCLDNLHAVGEKYKAIYVMEGNVTFSVDLSNIETTYDEVRNVLLVTILEPVANLVIDSDTIQKIAESKKFAVSSDADKGSQAYENTMNEIKANAKDALANYDSLMRIAKNEAKIRVKNLADELSFIEAVEVNFAGGEQ